MPYAVLNDLETRFSATEIKQLADRNNDGTYDTDVIDSALKASSSEMDSYLGVRYSTPIASVSDNLNRVCCDIARYLLHDDAATEEVEARYTRAIKWLSDIASGKAVLTDDSGAEIGSNRTAKGVRYDSSDRFFTDKSMASY